MKTRNQKLETKNEKLELTNENKQFKIINIIKEEPKEIKSPNWFVKINLKNLITRIKQVNLSILTLKAWLIILQIRQLVKQMLKKI